MFKDIGYLGDLNDLKTGWQIVLDDVANRPGDFGVAISFQAYGGYIVQFFVNRYTFCRRFYDSGNGWSDWISV